MKRGTDRNVVKLEKAITFVTEMVPDGHEGILLARDVLERNREDLREIALDAVLGLLALAWAEHELKWRKPVGDLDGPLWTQRANLIQQHTKELHELYFKPKETVK